MPNTAEQNEVKYPFSILNEMALEQVFLQLP